MEIGQVIKGYEIRECIGGGGFGNVYRAYQSTLGREVAIKVILSHFANHPDFIRRFDTEARFIARLEHRCIVPLYDYWRDPNGAYLVMRWIRGGNLAHALAKGPFAIDATAQLLDQITAALDLAHGNNIIHRDIKPANILLDKAGDAYLSDFNIAKDTLIPDRMDADSGVLLGSPDYMSPEQGRNEPVSPRSDIYSLGVVLHEMLTGKHPFPNLSPVERLYKHLSDPLPPIDVLPNDVDDGMLDDINTVIQTATAKNPAERYTTTLALANAFRQATALSEAQVGETIVEQLTMREQEILQLIIDGCTNNEIAQTLYITVSTVKWYIRQLYRKLGVRSRVQAMVRARDLDLIVNGADDAASSPTGASYVSRPEPENPYKGLHAFEATDVRDFFGREQLTEKLIVRLQEVGKYSRFLAVVGPSGSGKSSVVKAGLVPALWRGDLPGSEHWFVVEMEPGERPLDELEVALTRITADQSINIHEQLSRDAHGLARITGLLLPNDKSELVIVMDQFEEVFTLVEDEGARTHFLALIYAAVTASHSRVRIVITLRADFYDRPLHYPDFGKLMRNRMETILPLSAEELEAAIVKPSERVGVSFEDGLVTTIAADVHYQAGALPLLQYALTELFEQRQNGTLTAAAYGELGGAVGALAKRADDIYYEQDTDGREAIRQSFLRLVTLGEGVEDTRRRVSRSELLAAATHAAVTDDVIDTYAEYRLLTLDNDPATRRPTVEIAHEAILQQWKRLSLWLEQNRHDIRQQRLLASAAAAWRENEQDASFLLHGARLDQYAAWASETNIALTDHERTFLDQSLAEQQRRQEAERKRQQQELETQRQLTRQEQQAANRLRYLVIAMAVFLVVSVLLTGFALDSRAETQAALEAAEHEAAMNRSLVIADRAEEAHEAGLTNVSLALALEAVDLPDPPPDAVRALKNTATSTGLRAYLEGHEHNIRAITFSPDGARALSGSCAELIADDNCARGEMILWNVEGPVDDVGAIQRMVGHRGWITSVAISPDGMTGLSASDDGTLALWDIDQSSPTFGDILYQLKGHNGPVNSVAFSPDGSTILSGSDDHTVILWDTETQRILHTFDEHTGPVYSVAFAPDGMTAASASDDTTVITWDLETGVNTNVFDTHTAEVQKVIYTPDGSQLISRGRDLKVYVWDASSATVIRTLPQIQDTGCLELTPDGRSLMICEITAVAVLDTDTWVRRSVIEFREKEQNLTRRESFTIDELIAAASPDGSTILVAGNRGLLGLLSIETRGDVQRFSEPGTHFGGGLAVSPDNRYLLAGTYGSNTLLWDLDGNTLVKRFEDDGLVTNSTAFSPDGRLFVTSSNDFNGGTAAHTLVVWDLETGHEVSRFEDHTCYTYAVDFSPDGQRILSGSFAYGNAFADVAAGDLYLWDASSGRTIHRFNYEGDIGCVDFSSDGNRALVGEWGYNRGAITVWDTDMNSPTFGQLLHRSPELGSVQDCEFSPDETSYYMASTDGNIYQRDVNTDTVLRTFVGHDGWVMRFEFQWDQGYMISGDTKGVILLWDLDSGEELRRFVGHTDTVWELAFSQDGQYAFSTSYANDIIQWQIADWMLEELLAWIPDNRYVHELTCAERAQYHVTPLCE